MTTKLTFEDIMKLDAERTQGEWRLSSSCDIETDETDICNLSCPYNVNRNDKNDAAFIAAMPQAVEMLRKYKAAFEIAMRELDALTPYLHAHGMIPKHWPIPELIELKEKRDDLARGISQCSGDSFRSFYNNEG